MIYILLAIVAALIISWFGYKAEETEKDLNEIREAIIESDTKIDKLAHSVAVDFVQAQDDWKTLREDILDDLKTIRKVHNETMKEWEALRDKSNS